MKPVSTPPVMLVTGAARRIGSKIARMLHAAGAEVMLHYRRSSDEAVALASALNSIRQHSACVLQGDLACDGVAERMVEATIQRFGRLDALINNASSFFPTPMGSVDAAVWESLIGSNLKGPLFLSQAAAPLLRASEGTIVNIVDIHALRPLHNYLVYSVAKAGLLGLTRALAVELAPQVRVNGVSPGAMEWPEDTQFSVTERERIVSQTLLKREGRGEDIARAVCFLVLDAPYVTGQVIAVDGGRSLFL